MIWCRTMDICYTFFCSVSPTLTRCIISTPGRAARRILPKPFRPSLQAATRCLPISCMPPDFRKLKLAKLRCRRFTAHFAQAMPALPAGRYQMFADIVHATGFPETQIGEITLPEIHGGALQGDDSSWAAMPLNQSTSSDVAMLSGGGRMLWLHDAPLRAGEPLRLRVRVGDGLGQAATDLQP